MRRRTVRIWGIVAAVFAVVIGAVFYAVPALASIACPTCMGFASAGPGIYIERDATPARIADVLTILRAGQTRTSAFYGGAESHPEIFACVTMGCYTHATGSAHTRGLSGGDFALFLAPRGLSTVIASHELSHIEFHHRIGLLGQWRVPAWFDEGLAVNVSDDRRYLAPPGTMPDRCLMQPHENLPAGDFEWLSRSVKDESLYTQAACKVDRWLAAHGGAAGIARLETAIAAGDEFAQASR